MTTYYRLSDRALRELTAEQFTALQANGKAADLRLYVIDARPVPAATDVVIDAGIVVGSIEAHQTWQTRAKTPEELEAEAVTEERAQIQTYIDALSEQLAISNADRALLTNAQRIAELENDTRAAMRSAKWLLRQEKRAI